MGSSEPAKRRVVITGQGLISPLGLDSGALWQALQEGRSGIAPLAQSFEKVGVTFGGESREFTADIGNFGTLAADKKKAIRKQMKNLCRESLMGLAAAQRALADAGFGEGGFVPDRTGVVFGTDYIMMDPVEFAEAIAACTAAPAGFDFTQWSTTGFAKLYPLWLLRYLPNMPAAHLGIYNDLRGPSNSITHREAAPNLAVCEATRIIERGHADVMVAGATGNRLHPMAVVHALQNEEVAQNGTVPGQAARPFDHQRSGLVLGEGAGVVVLESLESARARGAKIYGEVVGAGSSTVVDRKMVARRDTALVNAMRATLRDAKATPDEVGHLQAHGLGTRTCDLDESRAINAVFGERSAPVPVTALKSYTGTMGAGSGMVELIAGLLSLEHKTLYPVLNYETPDPDCQLNIARGHSTPSGDSFLNLCVTPQGQASCVMVRRVE